MNNALDYIRWRGDLPLAECAPNEVDYLIFSELVYAPLERCNNESGSLDGEGPSLISIFEKVFPEPLPKNASYVFRPRYDVWSLMADHRRFAEVRLDHFMSNFEPENDKQFAAAVFSYGFGAERTAVVAFRGTDSTVTGWKEDFDMAYKSPIPAQTDSVAFLNEVISSGTYENITVCGHSKGGNLAMYSAAMCNAPDRIKAVYSFDGPGLDEASIRSDGYARVRSRIRSYVPQASIVGLLLAYHPDYAVVRSTAMGGINQHDTFTWQVEGPRFLEAEQVDRGSEAIDQALHEWLRQCSPDQRRVFVNTLFDILESTNAVQLSDMRRNVRASAASILEATRRIDPAAGRMIWKLLGRFVQIGAGSLLELLGRKPDDNNPNQA